MELRGRMEQSDPLPAPSAAERQGPPKDPADPLGRAMAPGAGSKPLLDSSLQALSTAFRLLQQNDFKLIAKRGQSPNGPAAGPACAV